jgi:multiple sugar transport system ATP-binding protein
MAEVHFERIHKLFGDTPAVVDVTLNVPDGEFLVLLGPSGCGKTTTLRMLAGFERPSYGAISIDNRVINNVPPKDRDIAMVFQSYALYPHMNVYKNLAFGMRVRRERSSEIRKRVHEVAALLELDGLLERRPGELSGGQRQRVALGRALIRHPRVFLMDEPLSNLDAALRVQMRVELSRLHEQLGVTTLYVTHDQVEAMTMGGRIAVMNKGRVQQVDSPENVYANPANLFVAGFIGSPKMNLIPGRLGAENGTTHVDCLGTKIALNEQMSASLQTAATREVVVGIRPEDVRWSGDAPADDRLSLPATVEVVEPLGAETYVFARVGDTTVTSRFPPRSGITGGASVELVVNPDHMHIFDAARGANLRATGNGQAR